MIPTSALFAQVSNPCGIGQGKKDIADHKAVAREPKAAEFAMITKGVKRLSNRRSPHSSQQHKRIHIHIWAMLKAMGATIFNPRTMRLPQRIKRKVQRKILTTMEYFCAQVEHLQCTFANNENHSTRLGTPWHRNKNLEKPANVAIFVAYSEKATASHIHYLKALKSAGFAILFINNKSTRLSDYPKIREHCWLAYDRINIGRDFGAYKDGILWLESEGFLTTCNYLLD